MTTRTVLLTGATGFIGGAIALELLSNSGAELICVTRGRDAADAQERLHQHLRAAAEVYGMRELLPQIAQRCRTVRGDLRLPECGVGDGLPEIDVVVHSAASLKFADRDEPEIRAVNEGGTRAVLDLAERIGVSRFCYISTAYVAGQRTGTISENDPLPELDMLNNAYERSKARAEHLVTGSAVPSKILRPSIVIGHSGTYAATSFTGMYGMLQELQAFKRKVAAKLGSLLSHNGVRVLADPLAELNLIPIDHVARAATRIAMSDDPAEVYHLTNTTAPRVGDCLETGFAAVGLAPPRYAHGPQQLTELDRRLQTDFYDSYLRNSKCFDTTNTEAVCGAGSMDAKVWPAKLRNYLDWFLDGEFRRGQRLRVST